MEAYNRQLYETSQSGLCDPWAYQQEAIDLSAYGMTGEAIGVIEIPSIQVSLPIYSGASTANLNRGAACLAQTSFPIGGENTNAVIAAHRGWNATDYLRDIEEVRLGDTVRVINYWEVLTYTVSEIRIIEPDDISQVLIRPGRDLLTVFTCHPYGSGGRYRYLLICERVEEAATEDANSTESAESSTKTPSEPHPGATALQSTVPTEAPPVTVCTGAEFRSSGAEIRAIALLPWVGVCITALLLLAGLWRLLCRRGRKNPE